PVTHTLSLHDALPILTAGRPRGLVGRARMQRMQTAYESFRRDGLLPATYEVVYGAAWGAAGRPASTMVGGEAYIAPGAIRRRGEDRKSTRLNSSHVAI